MTTVDMLIHETLDTVGAPFKFARMHRCVLICYVYASPMHYLQHERGCKKRVILQ